MSKNYQVLMCNLDSCIFSEESLTAGLDQVGEEETGSVPGRKKSVKLDHTSQDNHHLPFSSWKFSLKNCQVMSLPARFLAILPIR